MTSSIAFCPQGVGMQFLPCSQPGGRKVTLGRRWSLTHCPRNNFILQVSTVALKTRLFAISKCARSNIVHFLLGIYPEDYKTFTYISDRYFILLWECSKPLAAANVPW